MKKRDEYILQEKLFDELSSVRERLIRSCG
jgi:hypothetical protein